MILAAQHSVTGRQWTLNDQPTNAVWPDSVLVVPFSSRVADGTGKVVNPSPGISVQGGYTITSKITRLELRDLVTGTEVSGVKAVWVAGPGGDTPSLHVLGDNPFSWLTPHLDTAASASESPLPRILQHFVAGPNDQFTDRRRFGEFVVTPAAGGARLLKSPWPWLPGRLLVAPDARLGFRRPDGSPVAVGELQFAVVAPDHWGPSGGVRLTGECWPLDGGLQLVMIEVSSWAINPWPGAIAWITYRHRPLASTTAGRITLRPGHYEFTLTGETTGKAPADLPNPARVDWSVTQRFWVAHPPSLRPYIANTTLGDNRLFGLNDGFDPTVAGIGFPAYRGHQAVVQFKVPYLQAIFPKLRLRLMRDDGKEIVGDAVPTANPYGESHLPTQAQDWLATHGGGIPADSEIVLNMATTTGPAALSLLHESPGLPPVQLDSWSILISRYRTFAEHLAWAQTTLTQWYDATGPHPIEPCPTASPVTGDLNRPQIINQGLARISETLTEPAMQTRGPGVIREPRPTGLAGKLLRGVRIPSKKKPNEYQSAPPGWSLPAKLASLAGPVDRHSAQRFVAFWHRSGVALSAAKGTQRLVGLGRPVDRTSVEALCDSEQRPIALWLRTPEPVDWRRVAATLDIRHVQPDTGCPETYANRQPLRVHMDILGSPDGSSALLVARLDGSAIAIPRGEATLSFRYRLRGPGLVSLRPSVKSSAESEEIALTFIQSLGRAWPLAPSGLGKILGRIWRRILKPFVKPPKPGPTDLAWQAASGGGLPRHESSRRAIVTPDAQVDVETLAGHVQGGKGWIL